MFVVEDAPVCLGHEEGRCPDVLKLCFRGDVRGLCLDSMKATRSDQSRQFCFVVCCQHGAATDLLADALSRVRCDDRHARCFEHETLLEPFHDLCHLVFAEDVLLQVNHLAAFLQSLQEIVCFGNSHGNAAMVPGTVVQAKDLSDLKWLLVVWVLSKGTMQPYVSMHEVHGSPKPMYGCMYACYA